MLTKYRMPSPELRTLKRKKSCRDVSHVLAPNMVVRDCVWEGGYLASAHVVPNPRRGKRHLASDTSVPSPLNDTFLPPARIQVIAEFAIHASFPFRSQIEMHRTLTACRTKEQGTKSLSERNRQRAGGRRAGGRT